MRWRKSRRDRPPGLLRVSEHTWGFEAFAKPKISLERLARRERGTLGERWVKDILTYRGAKILAQNLQVGRYELDLIVRDRGQNRHRRGTHTLWPDRRF